MANLKPLHDHLVVKPLGDEQATKAGIILPETVNKERSEKGEVVAVGPGKMLNSGTRAEMSVSVGQTVLFKKYAPDEITLEGEEYLVISESEVLAIIE